MKKNNFKRIAAMLLAVLLLVGLMPTSAFAASKTTPGKVTLTKISSSAYNKVTISWKKTSNATNYIIYYRKNGTSKWTKLTTVSSSKTSYTHTSSKKFPIVVGQKYDYTVRAYNKTSKKYGSYNAKGLTVKTLPATVKLKKAALNSNKTAITVSWNKAAGCNYYYIYRKSASITSWKKIATVKSSVLSYTDKNAVKGEKNTYTVRAYYSKTKALGSYNKTGVSATMPAIKVTKVALNKTSASLTEKEQTLQLVTTVSPSNATNKAVTWKSSNTKVATVDNTGKVTAVANGTATITATAKDGSGKKSTCKITVNIPPATVKVTGVTLNKTSATLTAKGQTIALTASVAPSNASNKGITWGSSNASVATVNNGTVTAVSNGTATITATAADGSGKKAVCTITVNIPAPVVKVTSVSLNKTSATLTAKGQTVALTASVTPSNASNKGITWSSSNASVATVNNGTVTAVANGTATITATAADGSGKKAVCTITVNIPAPVVKVTSVSLNKTSATLTTKGQTIALSASVAPSNAHNKAVTWSSSNANVATVSNGTVTAVSNGTATITATAADGSGKKATCIVTVNIPAPSNVENVSLAGGEGKICAIYPEDFPTINVANVTFEKAGNASCIEVNSEGYWNTGQACTITAVKTGTISITAKYGSTVLKTWNITVASNWSVYTAYESWKRGVESQIWNGSMNTVQKLDALETYIKTNFKYSVSGGSKYYAYQTMTADCASATDIFGDMAKDIDPNLKVGYVDYSTGTIYDYMADCISNSAAHMCNAVYINGQWVRYDAQPPVNG